MSDLIFITGATGNVGAEIVRQLSDREHRVRVAQRNLKPSSNSSPSSTVEDVNFDFHQPQTFNSAFQGVKRVFLMRPPALSQVKTYMYPAIDSAIASGVEQIVFFIRTWSREQSDYSPRQSRKVYSICWYTLHFSAR